MIILLTNSLIFWYLFLILGKPIFKLVTYPKISGEYFCFINEWLKKRSFPIIIVCTSQRHSKGENYKISNFSAKSFYKGGLSNFNSKRDYHTSFITLMVESQPRLFCSYKYSHPCFLTRIMLFRFPSPDREHAQMVLSQIWTRLG